MEIDKQPRAFQDLPFDDLLAIKMTSPELAQKIDYELRTRYAEFRDYCDKYDALTVEQKEIVEPCFRYRMQLGAIGVKRCISPVEASLIEDGRNAKLASETAQASVQQVANDSVLRINHHHDELEEDFVQNFGYKPDGSDASDRVHRLKPALDFHQEQVRKTLEEYQG